MRMTVRSAMLVALMAAVAALAPMAAWAVDAQGRYLMMGPGQAPCSEFVAAKQAQGDQLFAAWISGYLTATNRLLTDTYSISGQTGGAALMQQLADFCRKNPQQRFGAAADALAKTLYSGRLRAPSP